MNFTKRQIRYYQHDSISQEEERVNDMYQGVGIIDDNDYHNILYYTESINKNNPVNEKQRKFMSHHELINRYEIGFMFDD